MFSLFEKDRKFTRIIRGTSRIPVMIARLELIPFDLKKLANELKAEKEIVLE